MEHGFVRIAVGIPRVSVADCEKNTEEIKTLLDLAQQEQVDVLLLPELSLTGYTCADLFFQSTLLDEAEAALRELVAYTADKRPLVALGLPVSVGPRLFNAAALLSEGKLMGVVPKTYLPNYGEFYEKRWFAPAGECALTEVSLAGERVPFGTDLLFSCKEFPALTVGAELCEDLWAPLPPSSRQSLLGATVLLNLAAGTAALGKSQERRLLVSQQSARCVGVYAFAGAGAGESTTDSVFAGHGIVAENGQILLESRQLCPESRLYFCDVDIERVEKERLRFRTFGQIPQGMEETVQSIPFSLPPVSRSPARYIAPMPFLPFAPKEQSFEEIFALQAAALRQRFEASGVKTPVLGVSGGVDSTLALLATVRAFAAMGRDRGEILGITMPGFGTTERSRKNALALMTALGIGQREISIRPACVQHLRDIGQSPDLRDSTYENAQARERTQVLMDVANQVDGLVIGAGNLSELALGFTTYGGDQMSMYAINSGIPKTLILAMVAWLAESDAFGAPVSRLLRDISQTPISPELLPPDAEGETSQKTEDLIGPYALHDFFLYHVLRHGFSPPKIAYLAQHAFVEQFDRPVILKWLKVFYHRFFTQQFKRSCMPDGPKPGPVSLSPRNDWRMPSDAACDAWLRELEALETLEA